jgi:hypothetical protein
MKRLDWRSTLLANLCGRHDLDASLPRLARLARDYDSTTSRIRRVRSRAIDQRALQSALTCDRHSRSTMGQSMFTIQ